MCKGLNITMMLFALSNFLRNFFYCSKTNKNSKQDENEEVI